jgi:hypothetical protein
VAPVGRNHSMVANTSKCVWVIIYKKCHPKSYHRDIKYHMTLDIIFSVVSYKVEGLFIPTIFYWTNLGSLMLIPASICLKSSFTCYHIIHSIFTKQWMSLHRHCETLAICERGLEIGNWWSRRPTDHTSRCGPTPKENKVGHITTPKFVVIDPHLWLTYLVAHSTQTAHNTKVCGCYLVCFPFSLTSTNLIYATELLLH